MCFFKEVSDYNFFLKLDNDTLFLDVNSNYYDQIQGQLYLSNSNLCYLVVYIPNDLAIVPVHKCSIWASKLERLHAFYVDIFAISN